MNTISSIAIVGEQFPKQNEKMIESKRANSVRHKVYTLHATVSYSVVAKLHKWFSLLFFFVLPCSLFLVCLWVIKLEFFPRQKSSKEKKKDDVEKKDYEKSTLQIKHEWFRQS